MAMAQKIKKRTINLLPNKGDTLINQFLSWALSVGRLLIIITETLALSVFIYRFSLDVKIIDLHDNIKKDSNIVRSFATEEKLFRNIQSRLAFAKDYDQEKESTLNILTDILAMGQGKVTFKTLLVEKDSIEMQVQAPSATLLSQFTREIGRHPEIQSVSVNKVENKTSSGIIIIGISADLKTKLLIAKPTPTDEEVVR